MANRGYRSWVMHTCGVPETKGFKTFLVGLMLDEEGNPAGVRVERGRDAWEFGRACERERKEGR
jgi:hypothetical protein